MDIVEVPTKIEDIGISQKKTRKQRNQKSLKSVITNQVMISDGIQPKIFPFISFSGTHQKLFILSGNRTNS